MMTIYIYTHFLEANSIMYFINRIMHGLCVYETNLQSTRDDVGII